MCLNNILCVLVVVILSQEAQRAAKELAKKGSGGKPAQQPNKPAQQPKGEGKKPQAQAKKPTSEPSQTSDSKLFIMFVFFQEV